MVDQPLDLIHIRAVFIHGDAHQLEAELLRNGEVAIIPGHGAEELERPLFGPRLFAAVDP